MPRVSEKKQYICNTCDQSYLTPDEARDCEAGHEIVYLPIERSDLNRLTMFVATGEYGLITSSLRDLLQKYSHNMVMKLK